MTKRGPRKKKTGGSGSKADASSAFEPLTEEQHRLYVTMLATHRRRAEEWESTAKDPPPPDADLRVLISEYAPLILNSVGVHVITQYLYDAFLFGYMATHLDEEQWKHEATVRYMRFFRIEIPVLIRSLSIACEERQVSSAPLALIATMWSGHWRTHPDAKQSLLHFEGSFDHEWLIEQLSETTQRILRLTEPAVMALMSRSELSAELTTPLERGPPPQQPSAGGTQAREQPHPVGQFVPRTWKEIENHLVTVRVLAFALGKSNSGWIADAKRMASPIWRAEAASSLYRVSELMRVFEQASSQALAHDPPPAALAEHLKPPGFVPKWAARASIRPRGS